MAGERGWRDTCLTCTAPGTDMEHSEEAEANHGRAVLARVRHVGERCGLVLGQHVAVAQMNRRLSHCGWFFLSYPFGHSVIYRELLVIPPASAALFKCKSLNECKTWPFCSVLCV
jgi:hypothetical protein